MQNSFHIVALLSYKSEYNYDIDLIRDNRIHTSGEMQAGFPTGRNAAAFTEARCNANQEPKKLTKKHFTSSQETYVEHKIQNQLSN